ncbi:SDR family NAD(P)-dependent oxidoreductase [bacterium]|nr:SDR family NAD(P)-dependent oxidoreductase [bacterium]
MQIRDRTFVVAGGSSGLGAACVHELAAQQGRGMIADLRPPSEELQAAVDGRFGHHQTDIQDGDAVRSLLQATVERWEAVDCVIICAGVLHAERIVGSDGPFDLAAFRRVIDVNLVGTFNLLRLAADVMRRNEPDETGERGVIVTTASVAAFEGQIGQAAYSASKGGVAALTLPAARELGRYGIRVCCVAPGAFETPMLEQAPAKVRETLAAQTPFPPRLGRPDEFAALVRHIIENPMLNGAIIRLDGALRMPAR